MNEFFVKELKARLKELNDFVDRFEKKQTEVNEFLEQTTKSKKK